MSSILSIGQSADGFLWIGTDGSDLINYDGDKFTEIPFPSSLSDHHFNNLCFAGDELLFASRYKGFYSYNRRSKKLTTLKYGTDTTGHTQYALKKNGFTYLIGDAQVISIKNGKERVLASRKTIPYKIDQVIDLPNGFLLLDATTPFVLENGTITPLDTWLKTPVHRFNEFQFGYSEQGRITLFNARATRWLEVTIDKAGRPFSINEYDEPFLLHENEIVLSVDHNKIAEATALITNKSTIYQVQNRNLKPISRNYPEVITGQNQLIVDMNGDIWISSSRRGLYKVSVEPFTKLRIHPIYEVDDISLPYKTEDLKVFISRYNGMTYMGSIYEVTPFKEYNFQTFAITDKNHERYYLATSEGLKQYDPKRSNGIEPFIFDGQRISSVFYFEGDLWAGVSGKGLARVNLSTNTIKEFSKSEGVPTNLYTFQASNNGRSIYFGANDGIYCINRSTEKVTKLICPKIQGAYVGNSCVDSYGNIWFTMEKGLHVVFKDGTHKAVFIKELPSNLFYTLSTDDYGNIILGTNKGLSIVNINERGEVLRCDNYSGKEGFEGYETHMRSQFKTGDYIFVGTIEGLFVINTKLIKDLKAPFKPFIKNVVNEGNTSDETAPVGPHFYFKVNNSKIKSIHYKYRIREEGEPWTYLNKKDNVRIGGLSSGNYTLEVAASYDGIRYSDAAEYPFTISRPFWQSSWFIIFMLAMIILLNVFLLAYGKQFESNRLLKTKDTEVHIRLTPATLLFTSIFVAAAHILGPYFSPELELHLGATLAVSFMILTLFFISLNAQKTNQLGQYKYFLAIGLVIISSHFFWELYYSNLHPFNIIGLIITGSIAPYILGKIRFSIAYSFFILLGSIVLIVIIEHPVYPESLFLIAIFASISLLIYNSYLRNNSLEKLIFISGIVNRGNMPVIAYSRTGKVNYVSENIELFIGINHEQLLNKNISVLNNYVVYDESYKDVDVTMEFEDNKTYLVPMSGKDKVVRWIEWKFKKFSDNLSVIIGQDVSERVEVQNTHNLLVQNVEDMIFTVDVSGNFIFINDTFVSKMGYSRKELINTYSVEIVAESHREEVETFYVRHFREGRESSYMELPIQKKNGDIIWIGQYVNTVFVPGSKKYVDSFISLARDITEERKNSQLMKAQQDDITASINYAKKIQVNLLPNTQQFEEGFQEHFIFYRPKDIVSGDFYWMAKIGNYRVIAVADCTGHGVPGAFMTVLGINLLNSIVLERRLTEPGMILTELDNRLTEYLSVPGSSEYVPDGMEVTIVVLDDKNEEIAYACAGSRFLINSQGNFTMYKGNNEHVGGKKTDVFRNYSTQYALLKPSDTIFLITDGFQDQFGGIHDKKYSFRRLLELLEANLNLSLQDQLTMIEKEFDNWKGSAPQTDDVSIIAFKRRSI